MIICLFPYDLLDYLFFYLILSLYRPSLIPLCSIELILVKFSLIVKGIVSRDSDGL
jgi:hypothetical protein